MARLFRLLPVAMVAAAVVASGVDAALLDQVAVDAAVDTAALSTPSAHSLISVNGSTPASLLADTNGCKPMSACMSLQSHLESRFVATGGAPCFGTHVGIGNSILHMINNTLNEIIDDNCCATPPEFARLIAMTKKLMNIDTCAMNSTVPLQYVSQFDFTATPIFAGIATSMLTTVTAPSLYPSSFSSSSSSSASSHVVDADSSTRVAPAPGAVLPAGAKDIIFDLGQCCSPYFEFINQNDEHTCCHEACWHMVDILGMYFTMEECCADGANQSGTYVVCP